MSYFTKAFVTLCIMGALIGQMSQVNACFLPSQDQASLILARLLGTYPNLMPNQNGMMPNQGYGNQMQPNQGYGNNQGYNPNQQTQPNGNGYNQGYNQQGYGG